MGHCRITASPAPKELKWAAPVVSTTRCIDKPELDEDGRIIEVKSTPKGIKPVGG